MSDSTSAEQLPQGPRAFKLMLFGLLVISAIGFFLGVREPKAPELLEVLSAEPGAAEAAPGSAAPPARTYKELMSSPWDKNPQWQAELASLSRAQRAQAGPPVTDPAQRQQSMERRAQRRAFEGAPPVIPHAIDQRGPMVCASCHAEGVNIKGRVARPMSHPFMMNCTQCHVAVESPQPWQEWRVDELPLASDFLGARSQDEGGRAYEGAPPLIPHRAWMRQECMSCHGPQGWPGIQTTHPERQSCQQCHGPSSSLDQHPQGLP